MYFSFIINSSFKYVTNDLVHLLCNDINKGMQEKTDFTSLQKIPKSQLRFRVLFVIFKKSQKRTSFTCFLSAFCQYSKINNKIKE